MYRFSQHLLQGLLESDLHLQAVPYSLTKRADSGKNYGMPCIGQPEKWILQRKLFLYTVCSRCKPLLTLSVIKLICNLWSFTSAYLGRFLPCCIFIKGLADLCCQEGHRLRGQVHRSRRRHCRSRRIRSRNRIRLRFPHYWLRKVHDSCYRSLVKGGGASLFTQLQSITISKR